MKRATILGIFAFMCLVAFMAAGTSPCQAATSQSKIVQPSSDSDISPYSPGSNNIALDLGQVFLMGDLGNQFSDAIGGQLHYTYGVSDLFGFDGSLGYSSHSDGKFSMATALMGLRTNLTYYDRLIPYAIYGLGFYKPSYSSSVSPLLFGLHFGLGADLEITHQIFFGAAITLHDVFGNEESTPAGPISTGGTFASFLLHAGYTF